MNMKIENFWYQDEDTKLEALDISRICDVENAIGKKFPDSFKEIYLLSNGGIAYFEGVKVDGKVSPLHDFVQIEDFLNQHPDDELPEDVYIFCGSAHSWYAFDYRKSGDPEIIYYDEYSDKIYKIADSFDEFIEKLIEVEE